MQQEQPVTSSGLLLQAELETTARGDPGQSLRKNTDWKKLARALQKISRRAGMQRCSTIFVN